VAGVFKSKPRSVRSTHTKTPSPALSKKTEILILKDEARGSLSEQRKINGLLAELSQLAITDNSETRSQAKGILQSDDAVNKLFSALAPQIRQQNTRLQVSKIRKNERPFRARRVRPGDFLLRLVLVGLDGNELTPGAHTASARRRALEKEPEPDSKRPVASLQSALGRLTDTHDELLAEVTASDRFDLVTVGEQFGIVIRGYGDASKYVLGSATLKKSDDEPAFIQLCRIPDEPHKFGLHLNWVGERPDVPDFLQHRIDALAV
jgi:ribosomal protein L17